MTPLYIALYSFHNLILGIFHGIRTYIFVGYIQELYILLVMNLFTIFRIFYFPSHFKKHYRNMCCVRKVMRLALYFFEFNIYLYINIIPFKVFPLGSHTPPETLLPFPVAVLEVFM